MPKLTLLVENVTVDVKGDLTVMEAAEQAGVEMESGCFQSDCGTCTVEITQGMENLVPPSKQELQVLKQCRRDPAIHRLACSARILKGDVTVKTLH